MQEVKAAIARAAKDLFGVDISPEISRPEEKFGDFATNVAMQLVAKLADPPAGGPKKIAEDLASKIDSFGYYESVEVAGPGFINITLKDSDIWNMAKGATNLPRPLENQEILVEFGDPNPFKQMHIGHLYSYIIGDGISSLLESQGASVKRLSYHGDVGRHVAMALYGLRQSQALDREEPQAFLGEAYAYGHQEYTVNPEAKAEIDSINQQVYSRDNSEVNELCEKGVRLSLEHFDKILNKLSIKNDKRYFESQATPEGMKLVEQNIDRVFTKSQGAVVYEGERAGLHTRVFITSKHLPTYEAKDLGLVELKNRDFPDASRSIVVTANEQAEYFKVMLAALAEINPALAQKTTHLSHGFVNLSSGKMSSRTGDVYSAARLITEVEQAVEKQFPDSEPKNQIATAGLKYDFLKARLGGDVTFDVKESVSLAGNSGPYLQYAYARARGILQKAAQTEPELTELEPAERSLARKISEYPEVVARAAGELMPHYVATYLYELAQDFNRFYEKNRVVGDTRQNFRLALMEAYANTLKNGLGLLNIAAPEKV